MSPPVDHVPSDPEVPARTTVVIIGGGIIGVCTAFFLARNGIPVVLCEKGEIAAEQSSRNWGWCRKMGRDPREMPLAIEALRLWNDMNKLIEAESGFRRAGIVYLVPHREGTREARGLAGAGRPPASDRQPPAHPRPDRPRAPGLAGNWAGALSTPSDGRAEPAHAAPAIAEAARRHGAVLLTRCAVRSIETQGGRDLRRRHRERPDRLRAGGAGRRRLVAPVLRQPGFAAAATEGDFGRDADRSGGGRAGDLSRRAAASACANGSTAATRWATGAATSPTSFRIRCASPATSCRCGGCIARARKCGFGRAWVRGSRGAAAVGSRTGQRPFERVRILDPAPSKRILAQAKRRLIEAFPVMHEHAGHRNLGRRGRRHAGWGPGDLGGRCDSGIFHRHRLHRPRLWHIARRRAD